MTDWRASAEWRFGAWGEQNVRQWFRRLGYYVVPTASIQEGGAPLLIGQLQSHVLPDLQAFRAGRGAWVEVKTKDHPVKYQVARQWRHGVDLPHWRAYLEVARETGLPGYLALWQQRPGPAAEYDPWLLFASFDDLRDGQVDFRNPKFPDGAIYFDVDWFKRWRVRSEEPPPDFGCLTKVVHPWERPPSGAGAPAPQASEHRQLRLGY